MNARAESTNAMVATSVEEMRTLVTSMWGMIEQRRAFFGDFKDFAHRLAAIGSPLFHTVNMWAVIEEYLRESFEGESDRQCELSGRASPGGWIEQPVQMVGGDHGGAMWSVEVNE